MDTGDIKANNHNSVLMIRAIAATLTFVVLAGFIAMFIVPGRDVSASSAGAKEFVQQLYRTCVGRSGSTSEVTYWADLLDSDEASGCSVAYDFVFSNEFQSKSYSNREYVSLMYKLFMGREADSAGLDYWTGLMNNGMTREQVFAGFSNSNEFDAYCNTKRIITGIYISGYDRQQVLKVNLFVNRLYDIILGRRCDTNGMIYWTTLLLNNQMSGREIVTSFINSPEFINLNTADNAFIIKIYAVMLNRVPSTEETNAWISILGNDGSRNNIVSGFASSPEFFVLCLGSGIDNGAPVTGWVTLDQPYYYKNSQKFTGWLKENDNWYYIANGLRTTGWFKNNEKWYYFNSEGVMQTGMIYDSTYSSYFYFKDNGAMATEWLQIDGNWYYFGTNGRRYTNKWLTYNDHYYYFDNNGKMVTGLYDVTGNNSVNGTWYYFEENGQMVTGWKKINNKWYYFGETGAMYHDRWFLQDGKYYYLNSFGMMETGVQSISGKEYYFQDNGVLFTDGWIKLEGEWRYYDSHGRDNTRTGFQTINGYKYYFCRDGSYYSSTFAEIDGETYYFDDDGHMVTGWVSRTSNDGYTILHFFGADGIAYRNIWLDYNGSTVYIGSNGLAVRNFQIIEGRFYYFYEDCTLARDEDVRIPERVGHNGSEMHDDYQVWHAGSDGVLVYLREECSL